MVVSEKRGIPTEKDKKTEITQIYLSGAL